MQFRYLGEDADYGYPTTASYIHSLERSPAAVNAAVLVGHMTLRVGSMADVDRAANDREIATMREDLREGMASGAFGFSTGLDYPPNIAASTDEVVAG